MKTNRIYIGTVLFILFLCAFSAVRADAPKMLPIVEEQMTMGPRTPGSESHTQFIQWLSERLTAAGWEVRAETEKYAGRSVTNIIAERLPENAVSDWLLLGAHYDCRLRADQDTDPAAREEPVPGANDGASGVAVLLGLAETLPVLPDRRITLAFFDAEDQGGLMGWKDWCLGSQLLAEQLEAQYQSEGVKPNAVIIADMIGDADLNIYYEGNSDPQLRQELWNIAKKLGYKKQFIPKEKYTMTDDHVPFLNIGIPAVDLIDFDYAPWHTSADTSEQLSETSLEAVYQVLYSYITNQY